MLAGLRIAADLGVKKLIVRGDSQLVVRQVNKDYQSPLMEAYVDEVRKLEERFDGIQVEHVPRMENDIADYLSKRAAFKLLMEPGTFLLRLTQPSVELSNGRTSRGNQVPASTFPPSPLGLPTRMLPCTLSLPKSNWLRQGIKPWPWRQPLPWQKRCLWSLPSSHRL